MKDYGKVRSTVEPAAMEIDDDSVWVASNITAVNETTGEDQVFEGFEYELQQYGKDEYIQSLSNQLADTQNALVEIYELIGQ